MSGLFRRLCGAQLPYGASASTRPGLEDATPPLDVDLIVPGPAVQQAITGPDEGVLGLRLKLADLDVPWHTPQHQPKRPHNHQQPPQQPQPQPQPQQPPHLQDAWGQAVSLYDRNPQTGFNSGDPIADCYGAITYRDGAVLALADGVNWGERPRQAARGAVYGFLRHMHEQLAVAQGGRAISGAEAFRAIRGALQAAQQQVLAADGSMTTLVAALVCPQRRGRAHCALAVIVGDSPAYVWRAAAQQVEELTYQPPLHGFHRDPRVCPGCLGYAVGDAPDMSNCSYHITTVAPGDVVCLASDGVSDNFDPVVRKQASARTIGEGSGRTGGVGAVSPQTCHSMALAEMAEVLKRACAEQQQQQQQQAGGRCLTAHAAVSGLLAFADRGTASQRELIESHRAQGSFDQAELADKVATMPGKLDHASALAYRVKPRGGGGGAGAAGRQR